MQKKLKKKCIACACAASPFPSKLVTEMVTALGQQKRGLSTERGGN